MDMKNLFSNLKEEFGKLNIQIQNIINKEQNITLSEAFSSAIQLLEFGLKMINSASLIQSFEDTSNFGLQIENIGKQIQNAGNLLKTSNIFEMYWEDNIDNNKLMVNNMIIPNQSEENKGSRKTVEFSINDEETRYIEFNVDTTLGEVIKQFSMKEGMLNEALKGDIKFIYCGTRINLKDKRKLKDLKECKVVVIDENSMVMG